MSTLKPKASFESVNSGQSPIASVSSHPSPEQCFRFDRVNCVVTFGRVSQHGQPVSLMCTTANGICLCLLLIRTSPAAHMISYGGKPCWDCWTRWKLRTLKILLLPQRQAPSHYWQPLLRMALTLAFVTELWRVGLCLCQVCASLQEA